MSLLDMQLDNETRFSKQHTTAQVKANFILHGFEPHVSAYVHSIIEHLSTQNYSYSTKAGEVRTWETKLLRHSEILHIDLEELAWEIVVAATMTPRNTYTQIIGKIFKRCTGSTTRQKIEMASELLGLLSKTPFIDIIYPKFSDTGTLVVVSNIKLNNEMVKLIEGKRFPLPSVVKPQLLTTNRSSPYATITGSVILGGKHHDLPLNLDHINKMNSIPYSLNENVIRNVDDVFKEKADEDPIARDKRYKQWSQLKRECSSVWAHIFKQSSRFFIPKDYDERGRTYAFGFHFNPQGDNYRKAVLELYNKELVRT